MHSILGRIHSLPKDIRKLLAGVAIVIAAIGFFSMWSSFVSSRLVAIGPPAGGATDSRQGSSAALSPVVGGAPVAGRDISPRRGADRPAGRRAPTPVEGIRDTVVGLEEFFSSNEANPAGGRVPARESGRGFLAAVGEGIAGAMEFIYLKLSRHVPPNL